MRLSVALNLLLSLAAAPSWASPAKGVIRTTNADRLARGLPVLPPARLFDPTAALTAPKAKRSPVVTSCSSGDSLCCTAIGTLADTGADAAVVSELAELVEVYPDLFSTSDIICLDSVDNPSETECPSSAPLGACCSNAFVVTNENTDFGVICTAFPSRDYS